MVLQYKFEYFSNNNLLIHSLQTCAKEFELEYSLTKNIDEISFCVESSLEKIEEFSDILSQRIPMSIFLNKVEVNLLESFPPSSQNISAEFHSLTFCTSCLKNVEDKKHKDYYNPFIFCNNCGQDLDTNSLILFENEKEVIKTSHIEYFETVAKLLNDGKKVKIKTLSGEFIFFRLENIIQEHQNTVKVLSTNLNAVLEVFIASKEEIIALGSIEKPSITLRVNEVFKHKNNFNKKNIDVRYINDMMLHLLSIELKKYGINFLAYETNISYDALLTFQENKPYKLIEIPHICLTKTKRALILNSNQYNKKLDTIYQQFKQKNKAQFMVLLSENELLEQKILNIYASKSHNDCVCVYSPKLEGILDILEIKLPKSINEIFEAIKEDGIGSKLLSNYEKKFPESYAKAFKSNVKIEEGNSIYSLWKLVCLILDFEEDILQSAHNAILQKSPRVDYRLHKSDKVFNRTLNITKLIQSGISYKLAGINNNLLALGYVESYSEFICDCIDKVHEDMSLDGVSFCGDMFSDSLISHYMSKSISKDYKIYYNKDFPIQIN